MPTAVAAQSKARLNVVANLLTFTSRTLSSTWGMKSALLLVPLFDEETILSDHGASFHEDQMKICLQNCTVHSFR
jgi:hypothetical protein